MFIVFGTRGVKTKVEEGQFFCPQCQSPKPYTHYRVRRFFTLFFIPVLPLDSLGEYVKCRQCRGEFYPEVLDLTAQINAQAEDTLAYVVRDVLVASLQTIGFTPEKGAKLRQILANSFNWPYEEGELAIDLEKAKRDNLKFTSYLVGQDLKNSQIGRLCLAVGQFLTTDTQYALKDHPIMNELKQYFNLNQAQYDAVVAEAVK